MSAVRSAICAHRLAIERARSADAVCGYMTFDSVDVAEAVAERMKDQEREAWRKVQAVGPDNVSDFAALAMHCAQVIDEFDHDVDRDTETFRAFATLRSACLALAGRGLVP